MKKLPTILLLFLALSVNGWAGGFGGAVGVGGTFNNTTINNSTINNTTVNNLSTATASGATCNGIVNDAISITNEIIAVATAGNVLIPSNCFVGTGRVAAQNGIRFVGQGKVIYTPSVNLGTRVQQPAGRDRLVWGAEYLQEFLVKLYNNTAVTVRMSGDSTVSYSSAALAPMLASISPVVTFTPVTNSGKSTADWISTYLAADVAAAPDVLIWHWGMNDAATGVGSPTTFAQFETNLRAGLTTYRATVPLVAGGCVLMTPNASSDGSTGRDELRNEKMRQIIRNAAEDFQCAFFDTYGLYQDAYFPGAGIQWMDDAYSDASGRHIHPLQPFSEAIAGDLFNLLVPFGIQSSANIASSINGRLAIGHAAVPSNALRTSTGFGSVVGNPPLVGITQGSIDVLDNFGSDATVSGYGISIQNSTPAASFTMTDYYGLKLAALNVGVGSTVTNQWGIYQVDTNLVTSNVLGAVKTRFGGTTAPVYTVDVTGRINATTNYILNGVAFNSATAPTIASGFGGTASIASSNGTATFRVLTGGTTGSTGVLTMPTATTGWNCTSNLLWVTLTLNSWEQVSSTVNSATFQNVTLSTGAALTAINAQTIAMQCAAY